MDGALTHKCLLCDYCKDPSKCNDLSPAFIAMHGASGKGGRVGSAMVPLDYRFTNLKNSPVRATHTKIYSALETYVNTFSRQFEPINNTSDRIKSIYLVSEETGTGKTTTACALLNEWLVRHFIGSVKRGKQPLQVPAYFLDVNEWQTLYNEFNRSNVPADIAEPASREYYKRMQYAKTVPFAVLDDIGVRTATEGFRGDLHSVINHRVTNYLPTVYTSNIPITELATVFDKRLYDRIRDLCMEIYFNGESQRGKR